MKRILCLWLPNWPIQRLIVARPELNHRAIILYVRQGSRGQRVQACSDEAQAVGVCHDMPLAEATALARRIRPTARAHPHPTAIASGPSFHTEPHDPVADRCALEKLAEWCERFSPIVGLEKSGDRTRGEPAEPESLLLDVTGLGLLFGGEEALLQKLTAQLLQRGYRARVAIADAIGAAWGVAHFAPQAPPDFEGIAPHRNQWIVASGRNAEALSPLPLAALRLPSAMIASLEHLGIRQVGQLLSLPRTSLFSRWGETLLTRIDQALGEMREVILAHRSATEFRASWLLEYATERRDVVEFVVNQLLSRLSHLLAEQHQGAVRLEIQLRFASHDSTEDSFSETIVDEGSERAGGAKSHFRSKFKTLQIGFFRPTASARHMEDLARLQFEQTTWPGAVQEVIVQAPITAPLEIRQGELFADEIRDGQRQLGLLIDRLSSRLGREAVLRPRLIADAQPERACRYIPLAGNRTRGRTKSVGDKIPAGTPADRPLYLLHSPIPLNVIAAAIDGPPARFQHQQRWHSIVRHWGPERIETGWWRGKSVRRDYYRVETDTGLRFWLFRQLDDGRWFLHGCFS